MERTIFYDEVGELRRPAIVYDEFREKSVGPELLSNSDGDNDDEEGGGRGRVRDFRK
jgi:hypothetical protein